jgi:hypothetical protein
MLRNDHVRIDGGWILRHPVFRRCFLRGLRMRGIGDRHLVRTREPGSMCPRCNDDTDDRHLLSIPDADTLAPSDRPMFRPQFRLRSLFIFTVIVPFALLAHHANVVRERQAMRPLFSVPGYSLRLQPPERADPTPIPLIRKMLGDSPVGDLFYSPVDDPGQSQLRQARRLFPETNIWGWPDDIAELPAGLERFPRNMHRWQ